MKKTRIIQSTFISFLYIIILTACSSDDSGDISLDDILNNDGYVEPSFKPEESWIYMENESLPVFYGEENNRAMFRKWVATKIVSASSIQDSIHNYLSLVVENTDKYTRFLTDKLNPNGKESLDIFIGDFTKNPPLIGSYSSNIYSTYSVFNSNGVPADNIRGNAVKTSTFNITKWTFVNTPYPNINIYKMSGTAKIHVMYWKPGTASTSDIHTLIITFNNVEVTFVD